MNWSVDPRQDQGCSKLLLGLEPPDMDRFGRYPGKNAYLVVEDTEEKRYLVGGEGGKGGAVGQEEVEEGCGMGYFLERLGG